MNFVGDSKKDQNVLSSQAIPLSRDIASLNKEGLIPVATDEEITHVIHLISPLKALGPEGMHAIF